MHEKKDSTSSVVAEVSALLDFDKPLPPLPTRRCTILRQWRGTPSGWQYGIYVAIYTSVIILTINSIFTVWAMLRFKTNNGIGSAFTGDCDTVNKYATTMHLFINLFGSLLLAASNYCMQCLAAPTRKECDTAHARGDWLDIGVLSIRNIFKLRRSRTLLWLILCASSLPIHLLYNSIVFKTLAINRYRAMFVNSAFVRGSPISVDGWVANDFTTSTFSPQTVTIMQDSFKDPSSYKNLSVTECLDEYTSEYVYAYNDVLLVVENYEPRADEAIAKSFSSPMHAGASGEENIVYRWFCDQGMVNNGTCTRQQILKDPESYSWNNLKVSYCLAQYGQQQCQLQFSSTMLLVVVGCNVLKVTAMLLMIMLHKTPSFVVFGDAVASYLEKPDESTVNVCALSRHDVVAAKHMDGISYARIKASSDWDTNRDKPKRIGAAATSSHWTTFLVFYIISIAGLLIAITQGEQFASSTTLVTSQGSETSNMGATQGATSTFQIGFGAVDPATTISDFLPGLDDTTKIYVGILLANTPQLVLSIAYVMYNALLTTMLLSYEWSGYGAKRQNLRVSSPKRRQRSTHWLQLPFIYSIPLLVMSILLHWLISQSIFLTRIAAHDDHNIFLGDINTDIGVFSSPYNATDVALNATLLPSGFGPYTDSSDGFGDTRLNPYKQLPTLIYPNSTKSFTGHRHLYALTTALGFSTAPILCAIVVANLMLITIVLLASLKRLQSNMPIASSNSLAIASACHRPEDDVKAATAELQWGKILDGKSQEVSRYAFTSFDVEEVVSIQQSKSWKRFGFWSRKARVVAGSTIRSE